MTDYDHLKKSGEISVHMNRDNIAVIQVRMGSSRFAGKTMANIAGKPLIWHIVYRLRKSSQLTKIIIATSTAIATATATAAAAAAAAAAIWYQFYYSYYYH